jgi:DNA-binding NarL/FixJ family response regulator
LTCWLTPDGRRGEREEALLILIAGATRETRRRWRAALTGLPVREVDDARTLAHAVTRLRPQVVLLDLSLRGLSGVDGVPAIQRASARSRLLLLTPRPNVREAVAGLRAGARGYASRTLDPALLRKAVDVVQKGEVWVGRALVARLVDELGGRGASPNGDAVGSALLRLTALTPREHEIALLVAGGGANKEIASELGVVERTVKAHLTAIFRKLGVSDRLRLALLLNGAVPVSSTESATAGAASRGAGPKSNVRTPRRDETVREGDSTHEPFPETHQRSDRGF